MKNQLVTVNLRPYGLFVSDVVTPAVSQEVWKLGFTEPRDPTDPARIFPRRPPKDEIAITKGYTEMIDPLVRVPDVESSIRTPSPDLSFDGMSLQNGGAGWPPDTIGDVGPNHYVQMVNTSFAIFDKNGNTLSGPTDINQLWQRQGDARERMQRWRPGRSVRPAGGSMTVEPVCSVRIPLS